MYWDSTYVLIIIGFIISAIASLNVKSTFNRYSNTMNVQKLTAERCAYLLLQSAGINDVRIERISGNLTDHYSPKEKVLRLSDSVYGKCSLAAIGVAAHECGHAIQHKEGYTPLKLRSLSVPVANIGSYLSWPVFVLGLILGSLEITYIGIYLFVGVVAFQLITLPVEINASRRAIKILESQGILAKSEIPSAEKVLRAAAYTYVAALCASILQLLRLILIAGNKRQ